MTRTLDPTHDPALESWVESANDPTSDFPIQNLPFGVCRRGPADASTEVGVAIGDQVLGLRGAVDAGLLRSVSETTAAACTAPTLQAVMALGRPAWAELRRVLSDLLSGERRVSSAVMAAQADVTMELPADIPDYTDFYASVFHATNIGKMFRPDNPLLPNYKHVPIGYHGRASSVVVSGTPVRRPRGQRKAPAAEAPSFAPCRMLDYELEVGFLVGPGSRLGEAIPLAVAEDHVFGLCLVNDWSARDIQAWEYQPLGPFLAKSFATSISPWVVTLEALAPFRCPPFARPAGDPEPLPYLAEGLGAAAGFDLRVEVWLRTEAMRAEHAEPAHLSTGSFRDMYWTVSQMLTHHASNGCNLRSGDLMASGTVSGPGEGSQGSLMELTERGAEPLELPSGERREFLEDGDEVILRGFCEREGYRRIGLGACRGIVLPA